MVLRHRPLGASRNHIQAAAGPGVSHFCLLRPRATPPPRPPRGREEGSPRPLPLKLLASTPPTHTSIDASRRQQQRQRFKRAQSRCCVPLLPGGLHLVPFKAPSRRLVPYHAYQFLEALETPQQGHKPPTGRQWGICEPRFEAAQLKTMGQPPSFSAPAEPAWQVLAGGAA
jgi:hypothetical protein